MDRIYRGTPRRDVTTEEIDVDLYSPEMNATQNNPLKPRTYSRKQRTTDITPQEPLLCEPLKECSPCPKFERKNLQLHNKHTVQYLKMITEKRLKLLKII
jgi:hypothetical protein